MISIYYMGIKFHMFKFLRISNHESLISQFFLKKLSSNKVPVCFHKVTVYSTVIMLTVLGCSFFSSSSSSSSDSDSFFFSPNKSSSSSSSDSIFCSNKIINFFCLLLYAAVIQRLHLNKAILMVAYLCLLFLFFLSFLRRFCL